MSNSWLVTVKYTDENSDDSLYLVRASTDVEAIRNAMGSDSWGPTGTIKSIEPKQMVIAYIDDSIYDRS